MMSKTRGSILLALGMLLPFVAQSGNVMAAATPPTVSGYVDTQYGYNFAQPANGTTFGRSYDAQDNNIANTAHLSIAGTLSDPLSYVVDLDAGHDAAVTAQDATVSPSGVILQEAYLNYACPITHLGFKVG